MVKAGLETAIRWKSKLRLSPLFGRYPTKAIVDYLAQNFGMTIATHDEWKAITLQPPSLRGGFSVTAKLNQFNRCQHNGCLHFESPGEPPISD